MNRTFFKFQRKSSYFKLNFSKKQQVNWQTLQIVNLAVSCYDSIDYRLIQVEFVLALGGWKPQLQVLHLVSKSIAANIMMGMIRFRFITQI